MRIETKAIHSGMDVANPTKDIVPPISTSTIFEIDSEGRNEDDLHYTRLGNPNRLQLEHLLTELEEGEAAAAFSSGVAAATAVFQALNPGDHILIPEDVYAGNRKLVNKVMVRWGLEVDFIPMTDLDVVEDSIRSNTRLIWIESPSNPMMRITDIEAVCDLAHSKEILVCVDNTWPSPINQQPLTLGADLVLHSTTKYLGGHSDILGGAIVSRHQGRIFQRIQELQKLTGAVPSPRDCWLLCRSIRSLPYRMRGHNENAEHLARFLQNHSRVEKVFYPGLATLSGHEIAKKQMTGYGGMISFFITGGREEAIGIVGRSRLIKRATSLGGIESTWEHRRSSEGEGSITPENLIRISVGLEHPDDLMEDLENALADV
ncbi:aminotransferase class I/II-fold pyridoxal phosphate-dependent enzyme [Balneolaceae bacterium YR4-1]|uniref:Aminotransferase class I/II-fold pyridoxal phosphate-dependent enzyme n=1 Tax=Halalkalibaculum roseum TaxID=2709311 RepID=A0A6M1SR64_9BACT|nr:aminotransferase class I/II-fold pyridoxal phosphate-dependent enzyme [Halalkalibaculum roseum]NGP75222.1 aminotransferase class I/II-fold pyridoxal phosphate-dependent enzyme [Halalkalibaculum roseum]